MQCNTITTPAELARLLFEYPAEPVVDSGPFGTRAGYSITQGADRRWSALISGKAGTAGLVGPRFDTCLAWILRRWSRDAYLWRVPEADPCPVCGNRACEHLVAVPIVTDPGTVYYAADLVVAWALLETPSRVLEWLESERAAMDYALEVGAAGTVYTGVGSSGYRETETVVFLGWEIADAWTSPGVPLAYGWPEACAISDRLEAAREKAVSTP